MDLIQEKLEGLLKKVVKGNKTITPEKELLEDLGLSSLQVMELIALIEDEFDIIIPINKIQNIKTVKDLADNLKTMIKN